MRIFSSRERADLREAAATEIKKLAQDAYAKMKKQRKTRVAVVLLVPQSMGVTWEPRLSVVDAWGTPYAWLVGDYTRADAELLRDELRRLGVPKVFGRQPKLK